MSLIYILNIRGPSIDPCGTPEKISFHRLKLFKTRDYHRKLNGQLASRNSKRYKTCELKKWGSFKASYLNFHWSSDSWTRGCELATCGFELVIRRFELVTCAFVLVTRKFKLVTRGFELATRRFGLVTRGFELVSRGFQLVLLSFQFVAIRFTISQIFCRSSQTLGLEFLPVWCFLVC